MEKMSWPGWETVRLIGRGSFGAVYEIQRQVFDDTEKAALKVISIPQNPGDIDEMYNDGYTEEDVTNTFQSHLKSIVAEYSLMRKLNGNINVVHCDDVKYIQHDDGVGWDILIKMELLTPLMKALPEKIPEEMVMKVAKDMCAALMECKKFDVVHRDIKPQNIFVSPNGEYKLGDFGIAKTVERTMGGTKIGTYKYMAPEVYNNQPYGTGADIYSLGLMMYWMLNERRMPFMPLPPEKLMANAEEKARERRFAGEAIPAPKNGSEKLQQIVLKACAFDPKERYASAEEMLAALNEAEAKPVPVIVPPVPDPDPIPVSPEPVVPVPDPEPPQEKRKSPSSKGWIRWAALAAAVVILILLLKACLGGQEQPTEKPQETTETTASETTVPPTTEPEETLPIQLDFTDWMDELPDYVTSADYVIEEQTLYSTQALEKTTSTESDTMDGWELTETISNLGEYGPWSEWSTEKATASESRNVETQTRYRYKSKDTTTSASSSKSGWELYDTTYSWGDYGSWSSWSTSAVSSSDSRQVETKTQYSYRDKQYTTSSSSSLSGWTKYNSTYTWGEYGSWSDWSDTAVSETDSRDVETRQVLVSEAKTTYTYGAYFSSNSSKPYSWTHFCGTCAANSYGGTWTYKTYTQSTRATTSSLGQSCGHKGSFSTQYKAADGYKYYYEEVKTTDAVYKTQYRYRTRNKEYTYYYYKWGNWSSYSDSKVSNSDNREVRTQTVYRYRDRSRIPTYHFYRWGNWSDWSTKAVSENSSRKVETKTYYRYQDKITETTYCFERWTDWSEYTTEAASESEELKVQTKKQYRYRSKTADEKRNPYKDVDEKASYFDGVAWVSEQGIMNGTAAETFDPNGSITRGQMVTLLWRAAGKPAPEEQVSPFKDVGSDSPYHDAVLWAVQEGIAGGETADTFGVNTTCNRGQAITFLYRTVGKPEVSLSQEPFSDVEPDAFYYDAVLWAYENAISSGLNATEFGVDSPCSRAQIAVMLYRTFGK